MFVSKLPPKPDFRPAGRDRAGERTGQELAQWAGRAGTEHCPATLDFGVRSNSYRIAISRGG